jgi:hypothetical protein
MEKAYSKFLRKLTLPGDTQRYCLNLWIEEFKDEKIKVANQSSLGTMKSCSGAVEKSPPCFGCPRHGYVPRDPARPKINTRLVEMEVRQTQIAP